MRIEFEDLEGADLIVDCIYAAGPEPNHAGEPLLKLFRRKTDGGRKKSIPTAGGIRKSNREDKSGKPAFIVLYTDMSQLEWPDHLDKETGIFTYYGDNREPGEKLNDKRGNRALKDVYDLLNSEQSLEDVPPFFVFKNAGGRDKQFLGLAVLGNPNMSSDEDLVAFWRSKEGERFQNYRAYFTILDTGEEPVSHEWIVKLIEDHENNLEYAPEAWKEYIKKGRGGINALKAPSIKIPTKEEQLECNGDEDGKKCLEIIRNHYAQDNNYVGFEACARDIINKIDPNFTDIKLTPPTKDGGRDGIGEYQITVGGNSDTKLKIDFSMEAKCYSPNTPVNPSKVARLISRIRNKQFGIFVTTSYFTPQVYKEISEDKHPILLIHASDIAEILRLNGINSKNIYEKLLDIVDENDNR